MFKQIFIKQNGILGTNKTAISEQVYLDFALAEFGSAIEMLQAAKLVQQVSLSKGFLKHALDEYRHTDFFKKLLDSKHGSKVKFDPRLALKVGFLRTDQFLFERKNLTQFSAFIAVNEATALQMFMNIRPFIIQEYRDQISELDDIISDEIGHLTYESDSVKIDNMFQTLLRDETKHAELSNEYLAKKVSWLTFRWLKFKYWLGNRFRHFWAGQKPMQLLVDKAVVSIVILILSKFRFAIDMPDKKRNDFDVKTARLML